jgi:molecular chaperone DnaK
MTLGHVIGIDLGTTNSCVAIVEQGKPRVIEMSDGQRTMPSIVAMTNKGERLVGQLAKRQAIVNAQQTVYASKRLIGQRWDNPIVKRTRNLVPYRLLPGSHDDVRIEIFGYAYSPSEIASVILAELKEQAEDYLNDVVKYAVITVPAYFNDAQRQATKDAGRMAGLEVLRIINEPTAAALAYGYGRTGEQRIAVYDMGGGTFDVSILQIKDGVFEVLSTAGDTFLGGEDFDQRVIEWLIFSFAKENQMDLRREPMTMQRLKEAAEKARWDLSTIQETEINLPFLITDQQNKTYHLQKILTREKLISLCEDLIQRSIKICQSTLDAVQMRIKDIDDVILVGGMTRMPAIQQAVSSFFGRQPSRNVNPDEVVALGAALQGSSLLDQRNHVLLLDVTPHTLGIMIAGGFFQILIDKNTTVPCSRSHIFTTVKDYQTEVKILVLQGESFRAEENELLGAFVLDGLRPAPRGEVEVEVKFSISAEGIVSVAARDLETNLQQSIIVEASNHLTEEEIQRMIEENRDHALASKTSKEFQRQCEIAEQDILTIQRMMPKVQAIVQHVPLGQDALRKADEIIERVRYAIQQQDLTLLIAEIAALQRTRKIFHQLLGHAQKGA